MTSLADDKTGRRTSTIGTWELKLADGHMMWSPSFSEIMGFNPSSQAQARAAFLERIHPEDRAHVLASFEEIRHATSIVGLDHRLIHPDGTIRHIHHEIEPVQEVLVGVVALRGSVQDLTEYRDVEQRLVQSESLVQLASRVARLGGWTIDFPSRQVAWSDEVYAIHGMTRTESPKLSTSMSLYVAEDQPRIRDAIAACAEFGTPFDLELQKYTKDGSRLWLRIVGEAVRDANGTIGRIQGAVQDISERKNAEHAQQRLANRLATMLTSITDGLFTVDAQLRLTYVNPQAELIFGQPARDLVGRTLAEVFSGSETGGFLELYRAGIMDPTVRTFSAFVHSLSRWLHARMYPHEEGFSVYLLDITASRAAQAQMVLLEASVAQLNDIVVIMEVVPADSANLRIAFANAAFTRTLGYPRDEVLGLPPSFLRGPATDLAAATRLATAVAKGEPIRSDLLLYTKAQEEIWLEMDLLPIRDANGAVTHWVAVSRDISARKAHELHSAAAAEMQAGIAALQHELTATNLNLAEVFQRITSRICDLTNAQASFVGIWHPQGLRCVAACGSAEPAVGLFLPGSLGPFATPSEYGELTAFSDISGRSLADDADEPPFSARAWVVVPFGHGDDTSGVFAVGWAAAHGFHEGHLHHLHTLKQTLEIVVARQRAAERLRESEAQYRLLFNHNPHPMWVYDVETLRILAVNQVAVTNYGYSEAEFLSMTLKDLRDPADHEQLVASVRGDLKGKSAASLWRHRKKDGSIIDVEISSDNLTFNHRPARLTLASDVTERIRGERALQRVRRAQQMLSACNDVLIRSDDELSLLQQICRITTEIGGYRMAWVGYAEHDATKSIRVLTSHGAHADYLDGVSLSWDEAAPGGKGPAGRAVRTGQVVVVDDITEDLQFAPYLAQARAAGFVGAISLPLRDRERPLGILGLYLAELAIVPPDEVTLLQQLADNLAFGIRNLRARDRQRRTEAAILKVATSVSSTGGLEFFERLTRHMVEALGAQAGVVARLFPDGSARTLSVVIDGQLAENQAYPLGKTPCSEVTDGTTCVLTEDVARRFPQTPFAADMAAQGYAGQTLVTGSGQRMGGLYVLFREPLQHPEFVASTLQIFATRAAAELARQETDARIREQASLLDKAQDAIFVIRLDRRITYWNKSAERLYGWTAVEAGGQLTTLLHTDKTAFDSAFELVQARGEWVGELEQVDKAGLLLLIEARWTLVRDSNDEPLSILAIHTDIRERKKLEQQFFRAQRLESIGTLAGGIAHDLNNVLTPIMLSIEVLQATHTDDDSREMLSTIAASAKRGAEMVAQVLSFARGMEGRRVEVQSKHLISDIEKIARDTFPKSISVHTKVNADLWTVLGDPTQLHQVLLNLSLNARDSMIDGGQIHIHADNVTLDLHYAAMNIEAKPGPHVLLEVEDTGAGIPKPILDKIFDPFFTTKEIGKGTGLGLSTSLAIVKSHGGFLRVYSEVNKGTRFRIYLPASSDPTAHASEDAPVELPRGDGETILVVDDEASIRQITKQTLEAFGYRALLAADGAEAVAIYARHQATISVVLTDMMMPVMDGPATIQVLRKLNPTVKIVAASGINANGSVAKAMGHGVQDFLPKPYTADALLRILRRVIHGV